MLASSFVSTLASTHHPEVHRRSLWNGPDYEDVSENLGGGRSGERKRGQARAPPVSCTTRLRVEGIYLHLRLDSAFSVARHHPRIGSESSAHWRLLIGHDRRRRALMDAAQSTGKKEFVC
ncbi:unnamed protein product [Ectocarpus sp. 13 AM-2016]